MKAQETSDRLETAAFALAMVDPTDKGAKEITGAVVAGSLASDDPTKALTLAGMLDKAGAASGDVMMMAAAADMLLSDLDAASGWLKKAAEAGMPVPKEPIIFNKAPSCICGPNDDTIIPKDSSKLDWEVELGVVIGRDAHYLASKEAARAHIAGYCLANDVSERAFQIERGGQWSKGKSAANFLPLGPWLVTADEVPDPQRLGLTLDVNGTRRQTGNTATMIFDVLHIVHYLSQFLMLEAGDVIVTGTPPGVGMGMKPPVFLKAGDVVELSIDGLGSQRSVCEPA